MEMLGMINNLNNLTDKLEDADVILSSVLSNYFHASPKAIEDDSATQYRFIESYREYLTLISAVSSILFDIRKKYADLGEAMWEHQKEQQKVLESLIGKKGDAA